MKFYQPDYCKQFQCTASQCGDNCCIGWEIDIDPDSYQRYQRIPGEFGQRLRDGIQPGEPPCFRLKGERCVMLNEQNLCQIYLRLGKEGLCQICQDHPLFTETFGTRRESGLGLCCEAAARLLLSNPRPMKLLESLTEEPDCPEEAEEWVVQGLLSVREKLFSLLQDRLIPLPRRMSRGLALAERAQEMLEEERWDELSQVVDEKLETAEALPAGGEQVAAWIRQWLVLFQRFEPINEKWTDLLKRCQALFDRPAEEVTAAWSRFCRETAGRSYEYEHLAVYYLFRYFLKSVYTGDCLTPVQFAVVSTVMIGALELTCFVEGHTCSLWERIAVAGLYSKQMEYSEENREGLEDALILEPILDCRCLRSLLFWLEQGE